MTFFPSSPQFLTAIIELKISGTKQTLHRKKDRFRRNPALLLNCHPFPISWIRKILILLRSPGDGKPYQQREEKTFIAVIYSNYFPPFGKLLSLHFGTVFGDDASGWRNRRVEKWREMLGNSNSLGACLGNTVRGLGEKLHGNAQMRPRHQKEQQIVFFFRSFSRKPCFQWSFFFLWGIWTDEIQASFAERGEKSDGSLNDGSKQVDKTNLATVGSPIAGGRLLLKIHGVALLQRFALCENKATKAWFVEIFLALSW